MTDSRYPHTYADDYIRGIAGYNQHGTKLSRSDAGEVIKAMCEATGQDYYQVLCALADCELNKTEEDHERQAQEFLASISTKV